MLRSLTIRDMVLIEAADLAFQPGLNVLTGETGAGKSILLDALGFVLGWRTRGDLVRAGARQGEAGAEFALAPDHPAQALLAEAGLPAGDTLILRRVVGADGRRQAWANDRRVTAETLRALADTLVELHGQQDDRGLLDARGHRLLLDAFAGVEALAAEVRDLWSARAEAAAALEAARAAAEAAARDADWVTHALDELDALDPSAGEAAELDERRHRLRAAEAIRTDIVRAAEALGPEGAEAQLMQAARWLEGAAPRAEGALDPTLDGLSRALDTLAEVTGGLDALLADLGGGAQEIEAVEERLFALRDLARKHRVQPDDLARVTAELRARRLAIEDAGDAIARHAAALTETDRRYAEAAARLGAARAAAACALDARMAQELPPLKLGRAVFVTEVTPADPGPQGTERVRFTAATNPGASPGPIDRIASGGELSRFLLALKVCLSARASGLTLIFDEIDRGVGGATADAVGRRLAALAGTAQVIVVTHAPQVAARAAHHWRVGKHADGTRPRTEVLPLSPEARREEIARMLAGDVVTDAARAAAEALIAG